MNFNLDTHEGYTHEVEDAVLRSVRTRRYILGPELEAFEREFATYCRRSHCVGVGSGTDALRFSLIALGIGPGDEVISPAHNAAYTAAAVASVGATNVFIDVDPETWLLNPALISAAITPRTRAIMPVHLYGAVCDMPRIMAIARAYELVVIEDAAQAHGHAGLGLADATAFSFYPTKNLGALGDGGAVLTNSALVAQQIRELRDGGRTDRYTHVRIGFTSSLDDIQAAVLRVKLRHLDASNAKRLRAAARYRESLRSESITFPAGKSVYHLFVIRTPERESIIREFAHLGIPALIHYPRIVPDQPAFANQSRFRGMWPVAERLVDEIISLPMHPAISESDQQQVINSVRSLCAS